MSYAHVHRLDLDGALHAAFNIMQATAQMAPQTPAEAAHACNTWVECYKRQLQTYQMQAMQQQHMIIMQQKEKEQREEREAKLAAERLIMQEKAEKDRVRVRYVGQTRMSDAKSCMMQWRHIR